MAWSHPVTTRRRFIPFDPASESPLLSIGVRSWRALAPVDVQLPGWWEDNQNPVTHKPRGVLEVDLGCCVVWATPGDVQAGAVTCEHEQAAA